MSIETTVEGSAVIEITVHPIDNQMLIQAAAAMKTNVEDFASLADYRQCWQTYSELGKS